MTGGREPRLARAMAAIDLASELLDETSSDDKIEQLGAHYVAGRLRVALQHTIEEIAELIDEVVAEPDDWADPDAPPSVAELAGRTA